MSSQTNLGTRRSERSEAYIRLSLPGKSGETITRGAGIEGGEHGLADLLLGLFAFALQRRRMIVALDARVEVAGVLLSFDLGDPMSFLYLKLELTKNWKLDKT